MEFGRPPLRQHLLAYIAAFLILAAVVYAIPQFEHRGSPSLHTLSEVVAAVLALVAGAIAIVRYQTRRDLPYLFIGAGLVGAGVFDAFHAWSSSVYAYQLFPSELTGITMWGWSLGRLYLGAMLVLAGWAWWWGEEDEDQAKVRAAEVYLFSAGLALLVIALFFLLRLPAATFPGWPVPRPQEFVAGLLFLAALGGFVAMGRWRREPAEHWLVLSLLVALGIQFAVMPFSTRIWDVRDDIGHILKVVSYGFVFIGLLVNVHSLHRTVVVEERRLTETNRRLEDEVSRRSAAEAVAAHEKQLLESIFESLTDGVIVADRTGRMVRYNKTAEEITGRPMTPLPPEEWTGFYGVFYADGNTPVRVEDLTLMRALRGEEVQGSVLIVRNPDRPEGVRISTSGRPIYDEAGNIVGSVAIMRDVTVEQRVQEQLRRYTAELERRNQDLQDFAAIVSHDLKEPLRKVLAFGERLETKLGPEAPEQALDYLRRMRQGAERMRILVDDLLAYTRLGEKDHLESVDLTEVAERAKGDLEERANETGATVLIGPLGRIVCDPVQMYHVFVNLIGNGLKYHRDGVPPRVTVTGTTEGDTCTITVSDNGIGFDMKYAERIFRPFHRLHTRTEYEGSGIGLAIVRKVVEHHGGRISVDSTIGVGTRFTLTLPVRQPQLEVEPVAQ